MDLQQFNLRPSRRRVQMLSAAYGGLALLTCYFLLTIPLSVGWQSLLVGMLVALGAEFWHMYRRLGHQQGQLCWDDSLGIEWVGQRWSYRSALFLGRGGVVIWVRRERVMAADADSRWPQFVRFSRVPIWLLPDMLPAAEWRRLCGKLVQTEQLLADYD